MICLVVHKKRVEMPSKHFKELKLDFHERIFHSFLECEIAFSLSGCVLLDRVSQYLISFTKLSQIDSALLDKFSFLIHLC